MLAILSPSKTQNFDDELCCSEYSQPELLSKSKQIAKELKRYSAKELASLMSVSDKIAKLNHQRYQEFKTPFTTKNARQALLAFRGDVYRGFELESYKKADFTFAQKNLRIISGLYGLLAPLDLIQPYRLEMKTKLAVGKSVDLYDFWRKPLTETVQQELKDGNHKFLINLASKEYYSAIDTKKLTTETITPVFKEKKKDSYKVVALFAKRARGEMANFIVKNKIKQPEGIKKFKEGGYKYNARLSSQSEWVFTR